MSEIMAGGRALIFPCFHALILFLSLTQFTKTQPTLQENKKNPYLEGFLVVKVSSHTSIRKPLQSTEDENDPLSWSGAACERLSCDQDKLLCELALKIPSNATLHK